MDAHASDLVILDSRSDLDQFDFRSSDLVLGQGSNVLFRGNPPGRVLINRLMGVEFEETGNDRVRVTAAAGEDWHGLVRAVCEQGLWGIENLALIPGTAGAAPVQNIGAYGVELADTLEHVEAIERHTGDRIVLGRDDCEFSYRDSRFKRARDRYLITSISLLLTRRGAPVYGYPGLDNRGDQQPGPGAMADRVEAIRRQKLPNPAVLPNAGSFFKNPVVDSRQAEALVRDHAAMPVYQSGNQSKLSAGWLIDQCGFKGLRQRDAGISADHALVLVNHGEATGSELWLLACQVMETVENRFKIRLEPEPLIVPA